MAIGRAIPKQATHTADWTGTLSTGNLLINLVLQQQQQHTVTQHCTDNYAIRYCTSYTIFYSAILM